MNVQFLAVSHCPADFALRLETTTDARYRLMSRNVVCVHVVTRTKRLMAGSKMKIGKSSVESLPTRRAPSLEMTGGTRLSGLAD